MRGLPFRKPTPSTTSKKTAEPQGGGYRPSNSTSSIAESSFGGASSPKSHCDGWRAPVCSGSGTASDSSRKGSLICFVFHQERHSHILLVPLMSASVLVLERRRILPAS